VKYYIISGEASGDLHASNFIREIKKLDDHACFRFWGGDLMEKQTGEKPVKHYKELAFMGFIEVILHLKTILKNISFCKKDILAYNPDVLLLVDYPGFNLRIAEFAKKNNIKVFYYISPTIWAWHESRVYTVKKYVDRMFVILPFEKDFYKKFNYDADFIGHPMLDTLRENTTSEQTNNFRKKYNLDDKPIIAMLPGSRKQEIKKILPVMLSVSEKFKNYTFIIAAISSIPEELYRKYLHTYPEVKIIFNQTQEIFKNSFSALVKSGTSTLEAALLNVPQVVCYKTSFITYRLAKWFAKVKYISLVNLVMNAEIVKELIQNEMTDAAISGELKKITNDDDSRKKMLAAYDEMRTMLGGPGASERLAKLIYQNLR